MSRLEPKLLACDAGKGLVPAGGRMYPAPHLLQCATSSLLGFNSRTGLARMCPVASRRNGYPFEVELPPDLPVERMRARRSSEERGLEAAEGRLPWPRRPRSAHGGVEPHRPTIELLTSPLFPASRCTSRAREK